MIRPNVLMTSFGDRRLYVKLTCHMLVPHCGAQTPQRPLKFKSDRRLDNPVQSFHINHFSSICLTSIHYTITSTLTPVSHLTCGQNWTKLVKVGTRTKSEELVPHKYGKLHQRKRKRKQTRMWTRWCVSSEFYWISR